MLIYKIFVGSFETVYYTTPISKIAQYNIYDFIIKVKNKNHFHCLLKTVKEKLFCY